ncbi:MAG: response regulator transcription factor [Planctomycetota bacterium]
MARVLIADDDRFLLELWERALTLEGHEVEVYPDGQQALSAIAESEGRHYDIAFVDQRMPGAAGADVLSAMQQRMPDVPVVMLSGAWLDEERSQVRRAGAFRILNKPLDMTIVRRLVRDACLLMACDDVGAGGDARSDANEAASEPVAAIEPTAAARSSSEPEPEVESPPEFAGAEALEPDEPIGPSTVLVIEEDTCERRLLVYCLERQSYRVLDAAEASDALELAEMDTPDAVIIGRPGYSFTVPETLGRLRGDPTLKELPVIALYEKGATADAISVLDLGADVALERPYEPDLIFAHLRAAIRRLTRFRRARRAASAKRPAAGVASRGPRRREGAASHGAGASARRTCHSRSNAQPGRTPS